MGEIEVKVKNIELVLGMAYDYVYKGGGLCVCAKVLGANQLETHIINSEGEHIWRDILYTRKVIGVSDPIKSIDTCMLESGKDSGLIKIVWGKNDLINIMKIGEGYQLIHTGITLMLEDTLIQSSSLVISCVAVAYADGKIVGKIDNRYLCNGSNVAIVNDSVVVCRKNSSTMIPEYYKLGTNRDGVIEFLEEPEKLKYMEYKGEFERARKIKEVKK
jgi:hypothetical protein